MNGSPIIIRGGSIAVITKLVDDSRWHHHKTSDHTFTTIPTIDQSIFRFRPSEKEEASDDYKLGENWGVTVFWHAGGRRREHFVHVFGDGKTINVASSHHFADHQWDPGYDGRYFHNAVLGIHDPIPDEMIVSGLVDKDGNPIAPKSFKCDDKTCSAHIGVSK